MKVISNDRIRNSEDIQLAEKIIELRKNKDPWIVINYLVEMWTRKYPEEVKEISEAIRNYRRSLNDPKFGQTKSGSDFERRLITSFPQRLMLLIRSVYSSQELQFSSDFYRDFATRYKFFRIPDKL